LFLVYKDGKQCGNPLTIYVPNSDIQIDQFKEPCGLVFNAEWETLSFETQIQLHNFKVTNEVYSKYAGELLQKLARDGTNKLLEKLKDATTKFRVMDLKNPLDFSIPTEESASQIHPDGITFEEPGDWGVSEKDTHLVITDGASPLYLISLEASTGVLGFGEDETFVVRKAKGKNKTIDKYGSFTELRSDPELDWEILEPEKLPEWDEVKKQIADKGNETAAIALGTETAIVANQYGKSFATIRGAKMLNALADFSNETATIFNTTQGTATFSQAQKLYDIEKGIQEAINKGDKLDDLVKAAKIELEVIKNAHKTVIPLNNAKKSLAIFNAASKAEKALVNIPRAGKLSLAIRAAALPAATVGRVARLVGAANKGLTLVKTANAGTGVGFTPLGWFIFGVTTAGDIAISVYDHTKTEVNVYDTGNLLFNWDEEFWTLEEVNIHFISVGKDSEEDLEELATVTQLEGEGVLRYRLTEKSMDTILGNVSTFAGKTSNQIHEAIDTTLTKIAEEDGESVSYSGKFFPDEEGSENIEEGYWATLPDGVFEDEFVPMTQGKYKLTLSIDGFEDIVTTITVDATKLTLVDAEEITDDDIFPIEIGKPTFEIDECDACATILACLACTDSKIASKYD
jgi:hypothetical protein